MTIILKHEQKENVTLPENEHTTIFVDAKDSELKLKKSNGNIVNVSLSTAKYHSSSSLSGLAALYQLNSNLFESSGNGLDDMFVETGTERYSDVIPGLRGFYFDGSTKISVTSSTGLGIVNDISILMLVSRAGTAGNQEYAVYSTAGETPPTNYLWGLRTAGGAPQYFAERGSGIDITYNLNDRFPINTPIHLAMVRENQTITFYLNGLQFGLTSSTLNTPDGGEDAYFNIGGNFRGVIASVAIYSRSLSSDEVKQEYNNTLGNIFGTL